MFVSLSGIFCFVILLAIICFIEFTPLLSVFNYTNFCSLLSCILLMLELFCVSFSDHLKKRHWFESFSASCCLFLYFGSSFQISFSCFDLKHFHSIKCIMVHICFLSTRNGYVFWWWLVECPPMPVRSCERIVWSHSSVPCLPSAQPVLRSPSVAVARMHAFFVLTLSSSACTLQLSCLVAVHLGWLHLPKGWLFLT